MELGESELTHYMAGRPFPLIDLQDPKAGEKIAWNHRYRDRGETTQYWPSNELRNSSGTVERASIFQTHKVISNKPLNPHQFSVVGLMLYGK